MKNPFFVSDTRISRRDHFRCLRPSLLLAVFSSCSVSVPARHNPAFPSMSACSYVSWTCFDPYIVLLCLCTSLPVPFFLSRPFCNILSLLSIRILFFRLRSIDGLLSVCLFTFFSVNCFLLGPSHTFFFPLPFSLHVCSPYIPCYTVPGFFFFSSPS